MTILDWACHCRMVLCLTKAENCVIILLVGGINRRNLGNDVLNAQNKGRAQHGLRSKDFSCRMRQHLLLPPHEKLSLDLLATAVCQSYIRPCRVVWQPVKPTEGRRCMYAARANGVLH